MNVLSKINQIGLLNWIPDKQYLKIKYRLKMGKKLNLENPQTYNEKLQWLKLYDRKPIYSKLVDKYEVREIIRKKIGEEYLIPLLGVYEKFNQINFESLPNQFVIKTTHDCGGIVICKDKSKFNQKEAQKKIEHHLRKNYYYMHREWPYKKVKPRIIIEKYMVDESRTELKDYKFFCFDGEPKLMFVATDRGVDTRFNFYDMNFKQINLQQHYKNSNKEIDRPKNFDTMISIAKKLSENLPHIRVDLYDVNGHIYFGELTLYHFSGFEKFYPEEYDLILGKELKLP